MEFLKNKLNALGLQIRVDWIYLDCQKALTVTETVKETVAHKKLCPKLKDYKLAENLIEWVKNLLTDKTQKIIIKSLNSEWLHAHRSDSKRGLVQSFSWSIT